MILLVCLKLGYLPVFLGTAWYAPASDAHTFGSTCSSKAVSAMQHRQVPPNLHLSKLNPHIDVEDARSKNGHKGIKSHGFLRKMIYKIYVKKWVFSQI